MITASNTKELESKYDLSRIRDDEQIVIYGGLEGKQKYNKDHYLRRVTYTGRQMKQIIGVMKQIESEVSPEWNQWQKAKKIYEVLGRNISYDYDKSNYSSQQCSNLTILLSRKGICAGYSLLFKEMMDRQGIECDYMRGDAASHSGEKLGKHAWNVLHIDGQSIPVDLTWDSPHLMRGEPLQYFGMDRSFEYSHMQDPDERRSRFSFLTRDQVDSIDTSRKRVASLEDTQKQSIIKLGIEETYLKFRATYGEAQAREQVKCAIAKYIREGNSKSFTRNGNARAIIEQQITPSQMLDSIISMRVTDVAQMKGRLPRSQSYGKDVLNYGISTTMQKYGTVQSEQALKKFLTHGDLRSFTNDNNARTMVQNNVHPYQALDMLIDDVVEREVTLIKQNEQIRMSNIQYLERTYIPGNEFASLEKPSKNIFMKTINWIKERMQQKNKSKPKVVRANQNEKSQKIDEDQR